MFCRRNVLGLVQYIRELVRRHRSSLEFDRLRRRLARTPDGLVTPEFIRVLQLLEGSSLRALANAVDGALANDITDADSMCVILAQLRAEVMLLCSYRMHDHTRIANQSSRPTCRCTSR